jgi:hypothetical protein
MCSRKWAAPLFCAVSYRLPASIQTPTVAVSPWEVCFWGVMLGVVWKGAERERVRKGKI